MTHALAFLGVVVSGIIFIVVALWWIVVDMERDMTVQGDSELTRWRLK